MSAVVLLDDDVHTMEEVVRSLLTHTDLRPSEAVRAMLEAHSEGEAVVVTCPREKAEEIVAALCGDGLRAELRLL
jgi:ATP-dependent Clp protease adapter protein ClpS